MDAITQEENRPKIIQEDKTSPDIILSRKVVIYVKLITLLKVPRKKKKKSIESRSKPLTTRVNLIFNACKQL